MDIHSKGMDVSILEKYFEISALREVSTECLGMVEEERVDESEQLHDPFILPEVFMALQQKHVLLAIAP